VVFKVELVSVSHQFWVAVPLSLAYTGVFWRFLPRKTSLGWKIWAPVWFFLFMALPFASGITILANTLPDRSPATTYELPVTDQQIANESGQYHVNLPPWGQYSKPDRIRISSDLRSQILLRKHIRIALHRGFLNIAWYQVLHDEN
jgi:hypothetical protein